MFFEYVIHLSPNGVRIFISWLDMWQFHKKKIIKSWNQFSLSPSVNAEHSVEAVCVLQKSDIKPAEELKLYSYDFNDLLLSDDETLECTISMFKEAGLLTKYKIPLDVSWTFAVVQCKCWSLKLTSCWFCLSTIDDIDMLFTH